MKLTLLQSPKATRDLVDTGNKPGKRRSNRNKSKERKVKSQLIPIFPPATTATGLLTKQKPYLGLVRRNPI